MTVALPSGNRRRLVAFRPALLLFVVALAVHGGDHFRRGMDVLSTPVQVAGNLQIAASAVTVVLVLLGRRAGVYAAIVLGFASAIGFTAAHLLPHWSSFSDSLIDAPASHNVTWFSWVAAFAEVSAGLLLGVAATQELRSQREAADARVDT